MRVGRVLDDLHMFALPPAIAKFCDGGGGILTQAREVGRIGPGPRDNARAIARPDLRFIGFDDGIQRSRIDEALLRQDRFERAHTQCHFREFGMVVIVIMVMPMPMVMAMVMAMMVMVMIVVVVVIMCHGREDGRAALPFQLRCGPIDLGGSRPSYGPMTNLFDLSGRTALVTGASGGLGARFAQTLAAHGARVALVARRKAELEAQVAAIKAAGGEAVAIEADITDRAAIARAFNEAERAFGTVAILVANAGIAPAAKLIDETEEGWRKVMGLNLDAVLFCAQEAARRLIAAGKPGSIVVVGSILGFGVTRGVGAYCTSKAAVHQLTKALALELAPKNIRVNALAPGYIMTDINRGYLESPAGDAMKAAIPMRRFGRIDELDGPLLLLASDAGSLMTGTILAADGGHLLPL